MKLAEALAQRSDVQRRLKQVENRAQANARHLDGEEPAEDAAALVTEGLALADQLEALIKSINATNTITMVTETMSIMQALAQRDVLSLKIKFLGGIADAAAGGRDRYGYTRTRASELKEVTDLSVANLRADIDRLAKDHRNLDTQIQAANWTTDLAQ